MYLHAASNISPQNTFGESALPSVLFTCEGNRFTSREPDYAKWIDQKSIRRMSRIIKMGVAAALSCMADSKGLKANAIITGSAYGCLRDSEIFLTKMIENGEDMLPPTAFIQSTHNTVGAQVALILKCHGYNMTYVHRGFSFESAMQDAFMLGQEVDDINILVGAIDEITDTSHQILSRFGLFKQPSNDAGERHGDYAEGTVNGEGSAFFLLRNKPAVNDLAKLESISTFYKPRTIKEIEHNILHFLEHLSVDIHAVDLILFGKNGDKAGDTIYSQLAESIFSDSQMIPYKQLCGEYPTSTAFALWLAATIIKSGQIPKSLGEFTAKPILRILIYNHYQNVHHSLFMIRHVEF